MSYEETMDYESFLEEWTADSLNIPVRAYWYKDESHFNVEFAHPRKLSMSSITVKDITMEQAQEWLDKHAPKGPLEMKTL